MIACTIFEVIVTQSTWNTIRIGGTNEVIVTWWRGWLVWDAFGFPLRFVVPMVTGAIVKGVVTPTIRDAVRVGGTFVVIVTEEKRSCFL
jgi:hypothetical protein